MNSLLDHPIKSPNILTKLIKKTMAEAILYGIAAEVSNHIGSRALSEIAKTWGFKDRLDQLKDTINTLKDVLLDAEKRQVDSHAVHSWLERLTTVVYAADDLFDEFNTIAYRRQLMSENKLTIEVQTFFSRYNQIAFAFKVSQKTKTVREKLDCIVKDGKEFDFIRLQEGRAINRRDQTISFVEAEDVIGREGDKKVVLDILLASTDTEHEHQENEKLCVIPIVGMGGLGKTTLAQLVYNDPRVKEHFELRLWVCVSEVFDIKTITEKILKSATNRETQNLEMDQLHGQLQKEVGDKKYLLVLDDVWGEDGNNLWELRAMLKIGRMGSKIILTTRSRKVADIMGTSPCYELEGLSEVDSWYLFKKMVFKHGLAQQKPHLLKVGKEIIEKCSNVPLAIITLGRLLQCEDESKWLSYRDKNLVDVMNVLRISYQHLWSPLKNCFAYCALFPKDYRFNKEMLIELWMAEGFIVTNADKGQSLEDAAEDYFLNLLQRGFFHDVERNEWGAITTCKMHDLIHDLAKEEAKVKCKVAKFDEMVFSDKILHLSFSYPLPPSWEIPSRMLNLKLLRTFLLPEKLGYILPPSSKSICQQVVTKFHHLRVLDFHDLSFKSLPNSVGQLIHLRYLRLSSTPIETLPDSITNLQNLQTLNLDNCEELKQLPLNIQKLVNLRSLDVRGCSNLTHMPSGISGLILLHKLPVFIVNHEQSAKLRNKPFSIAKLSDLKKLNNLRGALSFHIHGTSENNILEAIEADMTGKHGLIEFKIFFYLKLFEAENENHDEVVLEGLKPHHNLRRLHIEKYAGKKFPSWMVKDNLGKILPNLVQISLWYCNNCQQVSAFGQLRFLKCLELVGLKSVEYIESGVFYATSSQGMNTLFFPSLEKLELGYMNNLKGWWKEVESTTSNDDRLAKASRQHHHPMQFSKLVKLTIKGCLNLIFLPCCPNLEALTLEDTNKSLSLLKMAPNSSTTTSTSSFSSPEWHILTLNYLEIDDVEDLISLSQHGLHQLSSLHVNWDVKLENTDRLGGVFTALSSSLRSLEFILCHSLLSISKGLEHLTALKELAFISCKELDLSENEQSLEDASASADGRIMIPWKAFKTNLCSLRLEGMPKLVTLPSGIQLLTNLRSLDISWNTELKELPEWISCLSSLEFLQLFECPKLKSLPQSFQDLSSLNELRIGSCPRLTERCQSPNGSDWPKIQHIRCVTIVEDYFIHD